MSRAYGLAGEKKIRLKTNDSIVAAASHSFTDSLKVPSLRILQTRNAFDGRNGQLKCAPDAGFP